MKKLRQLGLLVIAAHWLVGVWHLLLVAKILPSPDHTGYWFAIGLSTLLHFGVSVAWWKLIDGPAGLVLCVFLFAVLGAGIYEHFLGPGLNTIFRIPPSEWTSAFRASVYALVVFEILGCWLGIRRLKGRRQTMRATWRA